MGMVSLYFFLYFLQINGYGVPVFPNGVPVFSIFNTSAWGASSLPQTMRKPGYANERWQIASISSARLSVFER